MGFLNAMLLFGTAAFAVPLGIHLLNRSRFYSVDWAAMHLLDVSDLQNARRIEWRSLLLLLLRCMIPIVLAVCMARPIVQTAAVGGASGRSTTVLLLDDSYSMQGRATEPGGQLSGWTMAQSAADEVVGQLAGQAELSVVALGGEAHPAGEPTRRDPRPVLGAIRRLEPLSAAADVIGGLRLAGDMLTASREPHRQAVVVSDFQRADWGASVEAALEAMRRQWETLPAIPELHLIPLDVQPQANVSVGFDAISTEVTLPGEPLDLQLTVENHGNEPLQTVPLRLAIDGRDLVSRNLDLAPNARSQLLFTVNLDTPGPHVASVELDDPAGQITADDQDTLQIETLPRRQVLLIEPEPQPRLLECETGFLQLALEATAGELGAGQAAEVRRVAAATVPPAAIAESDVIVLADVPRLADDVVAALEQRVAEGGLLCVFAGESLDSGWYADTLGPASASYLVPWRYGDLAVASQQADPSGEAASTASIRGGPYADPLLAFFDDPQHGQLENASLTSWRQLEPWPDTADTTAAPADAKLLLSTQSGAPLLIAAPHGKGRVLQWAITADETSGSLPLQPVFVPLMQRLLLLDLTSAVARHPERRRQESTLTPLTAAERASLAQRLGGTLHTSVDDFLAYDSNRQGGREIWRWLLAVVVLLLFAEMLVAGRLTRRGGR